MLHKADRRIGTNDQHHRSTNRQHANLLFGCLLEGSHLGGAFFLGRQLFWRLFLGRGGNGADFRRWRRERHLARMCHSSAPDHIVFHVVIDFTGFFGRQIRKHMPDIIGIERRRLRCHTTWKIGIPDNCHPIGRDNFFIHHGQITIATLFSGQINDHRTGLHQRNHILQPQFGRIAARDERGGDDNINLGGQFAKLGQLLFPEFRAGGRGITTCGSAILHILILKI